MLAPITIRFPQPMLEAIDQIADSRLDQPERASIIRELIAEALDARAKKRR